MLVVKKREKHENLKKKVVKLKGKVINQKNLKKNKKNQEEVKLHNNIIMHKIYYIISFYLSFYEYFL